jgi:hypothetical protein
MRIIFVHLGTPIPKHLSLNLERTAKLFPEHDVWLITDQATKRLKNSSYFIYEPTRGTSWEVIESTLSHPKDFRGNFWFTSLARFLVLGEFSEEHKGEILHVESDVLLAKDFPFDAFSAGDRNFYFPVVSDSFGIASTLYLRGSKEAIALSEYAVHTTMASSSITDMYMLRQFLKENPLLCGVLPSAPPRDEVFSKTTPRALLSEISEQYSHFMGVFDGSDYGQYLFGQDARNRRGWRYIRRNESETYVQVPMTRYVFDEKREFASLELKSDGEIFPLYSLHVHSKISKVFDYRLTNIVMKKYISQSHLDESDIFSFSIFLKALPPAARRRLQKLSRFLT